MNAEERALDRGSTRWHMLAGASFVFLAALFIRLIGNSDAPVLFDELYHVLAGRSWLADGSFRILDGNYTRGTAYTVFTGIVFWLTGSTDVLTARLPALLAGALLAPVLFVWLWRAAGPISAWAAALLISTLSIAVTTSQFARFYSIQALLVLIAAAVIYDLWRTSLPQRIVRLAIASGCLLLALKLQITTVVVAAAMATFVFGEYLAFPHARRFIADPRHRHWIVLAILLALAVVIVVAYVAAPQLLATVLWASENQYNYMYYNQYLKSAVPLLWFAFPIASLVALYEKPRAATFCLLLFLFPLVVQSIGGMKDPRYLFYAMPAFCGVWGIACQATLPRLNRIASRVVSTAAEHVGLPVSLRWKNSLAAAMVFLCAAFLIYGNSAFRVPVQAALQETVRAVRHPEALAAPPPDAPWTGQIPALTAAIGHPSVFITADDLRTIFYLRPYDLLISGSRITDINSAGEFVRDPRTGRRVVSRPESVERVIACYPTGVILIPEERWSLFWSVDPATKDRITALTKPILPGVQGFHLFRWSHEVAGGECSSVRTMITGAGT